MNIKSIGMGVLALAICSYALADGTHLTIPANTVVPVVFQENLSFKDNRVGDHFTTTVRNDRDFPKGTRIEGRIRDIKAKNDEHPAYMDLEFTLVIMPDGSKAPIDAVPIKMDLKGISKDRDGRYSATKKGVGDDRAVVGGALGGLVLGSLINKPFEGAFLGSIIGIIASESHKNQDSDIVLKRGDVMGALIERDFRADSQGGNGQYDDRGPQDGRDDRRDRADGHRPAPVATDPSVLRISFKDSDLKFNDDAKPYRLDDTVMVPLEKTADQMNLTIERLSNGVVLVEADDSMLKLELDSKNYRLNGKRGTLSKEAVNKDGVIYVPLEALSRMDLGRVAVNGTIVDK